MSRIERIRNRYFRPTIGTPEGSIVHFGDCGIYAADLKICTCGLHDDLVVLKETDIEALYPKFWDEPHGHQISDETVKALWEREWGKLQKSLKQLKDEDDGKP